VAGDKRMKAKTNCFAEVYNHQEFEGDVGYSGWVYLYFLMSSFFGMLYTKSYKIGQFFMEFYQKVRMEAKLVVFLKRCLAVKKNKKISVPINVVRLPGSSARTCPTITTYKVLED